VSTLQLNLSQRLAKIYSKRISFRGNWLLSNLAIPLLLLFALYFVLGDVVGKPYNLPGTDTYWHVTLIDEAHDRLMAGEPVGPIAESVNAGLAYLYDADSVYPEFAYLFSIVVSIFTGNAGITFGLMMFMASAVAQLSFYFGFRSRFGHLGAAIGALAFAYAPFTLTNFVPQGRYPGLLAVSTLPGVMAGILAIMDRPSRSKWILTTLAVGLSVAFHAMVFYIAAIPIALIAGLYALSNRIAVSRILLSVSTTIVGILIVWIVLPDGISDLTQGGGVAGVAVGSDGPGVRASTGANSQFLPFSIRWNAFDTAHRLSYENYAGIGIVSASIIAAVFSRSWQVLIFGIGTFIAYVLATGSLTPLWEKLPLADRLEPRRFLFPAYLGAAMIIAAGSGRMIQALYEDRTLKSFAFFVLPLVAIVGSISYDAIPMIRRIAPADGYEIAWTNALAKVDVDGRLFWNGHSDFSPYYFVGRESSIETVGRVGVVDGSVRGGFTERALAEIALYNTRAVITDTVGFPDFVAALKQNGFVQIGQWGPQVLLASGTPGSLFMNQTRDVGLLGVAATEYWSWIIPNSISIGNPEHISAGYLSSFRAVVLSSYNVSNIEAVEASLTAYMEDGGIVIFEEPNRGGRNLFGAEHVIKDVPRNFVVDGMDGAREVSAFHIGGGRFAGNFYEDAGIVTMTGTTPDGESVPIVQKKEVGLGAMYWVCCNIGNHTVVNPGRDLAMADEISKYFESEIGGFGSLWPSEFDGEVIRTGPSDFQITYSSESPIPILISVNSSGKRYLSDEDGNLIPFEHAGVIHGALLPAGSHELTMSTDAKPINPFIATIWLMGLAIGAAVLTLGWKIFSTNGPSTEIMALIGFRKYLTPKWIGAIEMPNGVMKFQTPRLVPLHEEVVSTSGTFQTLTPSDESRQLAIIYVEISNSKPGERVLSISDLRLHTSNGSISYPMVGVESIERLSDSSWISLLDVRSSHLTDESNLESLASIAGFIVFAVAKNSDVVGISITSAEDSLVAI
jgi:xanthosine utilization system XapX-like protein